MSENDDQRALAAWISAGLEITEVRALKGDAGYLLNNMIAKFSSAAAEYRISHNALQLFQQRSVDLSAIHTRSTFYGKKSPFIYEHVVPARIVRQRLLAIGHTQEAVLETLRAAGPVAVLLRTEEEQLKQARLQSSMPKGWAWGDSPLARYDQVGIVLSSQALRVKGAICR